MQEVADADMMTEEERVKTMQRRELFYNAIHRNQILLPDKESPLCNYNFLQDIYDEKIYSFKMRDVKILNIASMP